MHKIKFAVLKYVPDLGDEIVNIGLIGEIGGEIHERHLSTWEKVRAIDPDVDTNLIESSIKTIFSAIQKKRDLGDEVLQRFQRNVRLSGPEELTFDEEQDALLIFEMIYAQLVKGRKKDFPPIEGILSEASTLVSDPGRRKRVEGGNISEVRMEVERLGRDDVVLEEYLTLLALSNSEADWIVASKEAFASNLSQGKLFIILSYRFWFAGKVEYAIRVAKEGLNRLLQNQPIDVSTVARLKNNLAYFYAELRRPENEEDTRKFSDDARKEMTDRETIDTRGYVLISYGKSEEEILRGVELCEEARREGAPFHLYYKHISRAHERLKELGVA